jgi:hypothetical protein
MYGEYDDNYCLCGRKSEPPWVLGEILCHRQQLMQVGTYSVIQAYADMLEVGVPSKNEKQDPSMTVVEQRSHFGNCFSLLS